MANEEYIKLSQEHDFLIPIQDKVLGVKEGDWKRLKKLVGRCNLSTELWTIIASASFGVSGSSFTVWITLFWENEQTGNTRLKDIMLGLTLLGLFIGALCLVFHFQRKNQVKATIDDVKEEMQIIENAFVRS